MAEAQAAFPELSAYAEEHGYRLALLGSVLVKGEGNDLDLFAIPLRDKCQTEWALLCKFGGQIIRRHSNRYKGVCSFEVKKDGRMYHWIFGAFWSRGEG